MITRIDFATDHTTSGHLAAAGSDAIAHPVMVPLLATQPEPVRARVRRVLSKAAREGWTVAQTARRLRGPCLDGRGAMVVARTGLAVVSDRSRPY